MVKNKFILCLLWQLIQISRVRSVPGIREVLEELGYSPQCTSTFLQNCQKDVFDPSENYPTKQIIQEMISQQEKRHQTELEGIKTQISQVLAIVQTSEKFKRTQDTQETLTQQNKKSNSTPINQNEKQVTSQISQILGLVKALQPKPKNCAELQKRGYNTSGVYKIFLAGCGVSVFCDQVTDGGGYTVIQRRLPLTIREDFNRNWQAYKDGFGEPNGEYWLGLENMHSLTSGQKIELRIDMEDEKGETKYAKYDDFYIGGSKTNYQLNFGVFSGDVAVDNLRKHNQKPFTTADVDNDDNSGNCAHSHHGGWWFFNCDEVNLNGNPLSKTEDGIEWESWTHSLKKTAMKIRPVCKR